MNVNWMAGAGCHICLCRPDIEAFMICEVLENEAVATVSASAGSAILKNQRLDFC